MKRERLVMKTAWTVVAIAAAMLTVSCADTGPGEEQAATTTNITWASLTSASGDLSTCQLCHSNGSGQPVGGLYFTSDQYANVLAATSPDCGSVTAMITKGSKADSVMYLIASGDSKCSGFSPDPMPGAAAVAADIGAWIDAGAPQ